MKKINGTPYANRFDTDEIKNLILQDKEIQSFIQKHHLTADEISLSLSKFNQYRLEKERFLKNDVQYVAKGYEPVLIMNEGYADVSYLETKEHHLEIKKQEASDRINLINLPKSYREISLTDIELDDVNRMKVVDELITFIANYPKFTKGLYLYGDMGIGKSFMLAAMARDLSEKKGVATTMIHFPSFTIDIKNAIKEGKVKEEIDILKSAEVLILDDIGAEQASSWVRDEVLQVILQYRMLENLPTFFTSNYSMSDLEEKLSSGRSEGEVWESKRVMERVRYLANELHLEGVNRRS